MIRKVLSHFSRSKTFFFILRTWFRFFPKGFVYFGHGISNTRHDSFIERIHLPKDQLEDLLGFWKKLGFEFVSMNELENLADKGFKCKKPWIHITLDDGYRNNLTEALPIFEKYQVPFTVFVSTDQVRTGRRFDTFIIRTAILYARQEIKLPFIKDTLPRDANRKERIRYVKLVSKVYKRLSYEESRLFVDAAYGILDKKDWDELFDFYENDRPLSVEELKELSQSKLVCIGSHGVNHLIHNKKHLNSYCINDVVDSRVWLEETLDKTVDAFAFPNGGIGDFSDDCIKNCVNSDYCMVFTTLKYPITIDTFRFKIPRHFLSGDYYGMLKWLMKN